MTDWIVRRWPLLVIIGALFVFDTLSVYGLHLLAPTPDWALIGTIVGIWWGQIVLAVAIAGLAGRTWIEGYSIGLTFILLVSVAFAGSMLASGEVRSFSTDELVCLAAIPSLMFAACLPLYFLRQWRGWRFISKTSEQTSVTGASSQAVGIEDLFLVTTMVAAALILARIPNVWWEIESGEYWSYLVGGSLILCVVTTLLIVPTCWMVFRIHRWHQRTVGLVLVPIETACASLGCKFQGK